MQEEIKKMHPQEDVFFNKVLELFEKSKIPFMVAGTYAFYEYTDLKRQTKDLDVFCKPSDYPKALNYFKEKGFETEITDERWIAKIYNKNYYVDIIYGIFLGIWHVDDTWFKYSPIKKILGIWVNIIPPEEMIWSKTYIQDRLLYGGPDINHLILRLGKKLDWKRLMMRMEKDWELLLAHLLNFRYVYPTERGIVPQWVLEELIGRVKDQLKLPLPRGKISRGDLLSRFEYLADYEKWGFKSVSQDASVDYKTQKSILKGKK